MPDHKWQGVKQESSSRSLTYSFFVSVSTG